MTNNLINETSPYLLQHKDNPVKWFSWNSKTLSFAKNQKLPILLSVGYSSCHWCHVMAHESFEDKNIAQIMNSKFINIKVDREERPDVDSLYQASLSLMGQQGGWPLTMFLDNNLVPFWGGTYFPNKRRYGMPSFEDVLIHISNIYNTNKDQVSNNSKAISENLKKFFYEPSEIDYSEKDFAKIFNQTSSSFDMINGGLKGAPKFPMSPLLSVFLFVSAYKNEYGNEMFLNLKKTLLSMCLGGIYDHLAGGFSRYSTDIYWLAPHFEKMLYDNAQLIEILSSFSLLDDSCIYKNRIQKTIFWLSENMVNNKNGYSSCFSAVDADSEGEEGRFYVWGSDEIKKVLKNKSDDFIKEYGIKEGGNWEGKNILNRMGLSSEKEVSYEISSANQLNLKSLLIERNNRRPPMIDTKILTDWNSMLICGLLRAFIVFDNNEYLTMANRIYLFLKEKHFIKNKLFHSSCNDQLGSEGFLEDYANLIKASFMFYEVDGDEKKLVFAKNLVSIVKDNFFNKKLCDFSLASKTNSDLFLNITNKLDNAVPSGSGLMMEMLIKSFFYFGNNQDIEIVDTGIKNNWEKVMSNPIPSMGYVKAAYLKLKGYNFVAIIKDDNFGIVVKKYLLKLGAFSVLTFFYDEKNIPKNSVVGKNRSVGGGSTVYVCSGFVCSKPITEMDEMKFWIKENLKEVFVSG